MLGIGSLWNFIKRHKRKFIFGGILAGGGTFFYRYLQEKVKEIQEKEASECLAHARKQHHFDSNQRTCNMTVLSMVSTLREALIRTFNTEEITEQLKNNPENKVQLWEDLKIMSFARTVSIVYSCSIMALLLRVQLNVIGGYMFIDSMHQQNGKTEKILISKELQQKYLSDIQHFFSTGLTELTDTVQHVVRKEILSISLKERLTIDNLQAIIQQIRERIETSPDISDLSPTFILCKYMVPCIQISQQEEDAMYTRLHTETKDIIESADFHSVLKLCLDRGFAKLLDSLADHYKHMLEDQHRQNFHEVALPMAKLIPIVSGLLYKLCSDAPNPLIQEILLLEPTKTFAANIYEAFSEQQTEQLAI